MEAKTKSQSHSRPKLLGLGEGIACRDSSVCKAGIEPVRSLLRRPMRERIRVDVTGGHFLQTVVAHGGSRAHRGFDVSFFQEATLLRGVRPHACKAIRLQFQFHGHGIHFARVALL